MTNPEITQPISLFDGDRSTLSPKDLAAIERAEALINKPIPPEPKTPIEAKARDMWYTGPKMPDKGKLDGSCNRSVCQMPLAGQEQWVMSGGLHYCAPCAKMFNDNNAQHREPPRATLVCR